MKFSLKFAAWLFTIMPLAVSPDLRAAAPAAPQAKAPRIQFLETNFNFGTVQPTDTLKHEFIVTNTGTAVLEITAVQPGCGCTTAGEWDHEVQPGETGHIPIQFKPNNFRGTVTKAVVVTCNDATQSTHTLHIQATIVRPFEVRPQFVYFLPIKGESSNETRIVRITNTMEQAVTLEPPQSTNAAFKTELKTVRPGKEFELRVTYAGPFTNAVEQGQIIINTSSTNAPALNINVSARLQPALTAMPQIVRLPPGPFSPDYWFAVAVRNQGQTSVKLSDPSVDVDGITVQVHETQPGKTFTLSLGFSSNFQLPPDHPATLTVKTTHPSHPVLKVPIIQTAASPAFSKQVAPASGAGGK